jgi:hypothetical protein
MEWFKEAVAGAMLTILLAWHWYDKSQRDARFVKLEARMAHAEAVTNKQQTQLEVMTVQMIASSDNVDLRLSHMQTSMDKIAVWIDKQMEKPHG